MLGPLTNPASPTNMLVGVYAPELTEPMARTLGQMGRRAAYVVHGTYGDGRGLDEMLTTGPSRISHLKDGTVRTFDFDPADLGFARAARGHPQRQRLLTRRAPVARGELARRLPHTGPKRDVVLLLPRARAGTETDDFNAGWQRPRKASTAAPRPTCWPTLRAKTKTFE
ncbi:MAG: hypothetical protein R2854_29815 [Caldilineaceae bacterium]